MEEYPKQELDPSWITGGIQKKTVKWAEGFAEYLISEKSIDSQGQVRKNDWNKPIKAKPLSTTQIRRFFGEVKRIQNSNDFEKEKESILMLKPQLAYAVGRTNDRKHDKIVAFYSQIAIALDAIDVDDSSKCATQFKNFVKVYEAIVAYHRAKGGK